jgi:Flp pilus assembly protein TadG
MSRPIFSKASPAEDGSLIVIMALGMAILVVLLAVAIDLGQFYVVKNELQNVADAAALAGAKQLLQAKSGDSAVAVYCSDATTAAQNCALLNQSSGQGMSIAAADVIVGQWDAKANQFVKTGCSANPLEVTALQVTVRRQPGYNPQIDTFFAKIFGLTAQSSSATATALLGLTGTSALDLPFAVPANYVAGQLPYAQLESGPFGWLAPTPAYAANPQYTWHDYGGSSLDTTRGTWIMPNYNERADSGKMQNYLKGPQQGGAQYPQLRVGDQVYPLSEYYYGSYNQTNFTLLKTRFNAAKNPTTGKWRITAAVYSTNTVSGLARQNSWLQLAGRFLPGVSQAWACTPYSYPAVYVQGFITLDVTGVSATYNPGQCHSLVTTDGTTQVTNPCSCRNQLYAKLEVPTTLNTVTSDKGGSPVPFQRDYQDMNAAAAAVGVFAAVPRLVK